MKRFCNFLVALAFVAGVIAFAVAIVFDDPYFAPADMRFQAFLKAWGVGDASAAFILGFIAALPALALLVIAWFVRKSPGALRYGVFICAAVWAGVSGQFFYDVESFTQLRKEALESGPEISAALGAHFIIGYVDVRDIEPLAEQGLIAGVYLTRHNVIGKSVAQVRAEVDRLQVLRAKAGLRPLLVAADQEGGLVSHMTPPAPRRPNLSGLDAFSLEQAEENARWLGAAIGQDLEQLGVNLNFAPVVDLRAPESEVFSQNHKDWSQIARRAASSDPARTAALALSFIDGLNQSSILATIKHFPGLGRVGADTHAGPATLNAQQASLETQEFIPFREIALKREVFLMASHVIAPAIDPQWPISQSLTAITDLARNAWGFQGPIITDDLVMGAVFDDACAGVARSLNAGVDLLLIAYDGRQYYRLFQCAKNAYRQGALKSSALSESIKRLNIAARKMAVSAHAP